MLAAAIGDAMGHPTEFMSIAEIEHRFGPLGVTGYELFRELDGLRFAPYTDDTQMAEVVLRSLLASRAHDESLDETMERMARGFVSWAADPQGGHRAPGNACLAGCHALSRGAHWSVAGGETAGGCGSVMRAYPFGLVFRDDPALAARVAVEHSKLTHRDPIALAASGAMALGVALALRGDEPAVVVDAMIAEARTHSEATADMMAQAREDAVNGVTPRTTLDRLRGWSAHEAIAAAVYIFLRHPDDARAAILEGANTEGDSDSLATLAGALVGARVGLEGIDPSWVAELERTSELAELGRQVVSDLVWSAIRQDPGAQTLARPTAHHPAKPAC